jgi:hypothetical protein
MNSSVALSNFENTGARFTEGYFAAFCGAPGLVALCRFDYPLAPTKAQIHLLFESLQIEGTRSDRPS